MDTVIKMIALYGAAQTAYRLAKSTGMAKDVASKKVLKIATDNSEKISKLKKTKPKEIKDQGAKDITKNSESYAKAKEAKKGPQKKVTKVSNQDSEEVSHVMTKNRRKQKKLLAERENRKLIEAKERKLTAENKKNRDLELPDPDDMFAEQISDDIRAYRKKGINLNKDRNDLAARQSARKKEAAKAKKADGKHQKSLLKYDAHKTGTRNK